MVQRIKGRDEHKLVPTFLFLVFAKRRPHNRNRGEVPRGMIIGTDLTNPKTMILFILGNKNQRSILHGITYLHPVQGYI